MGKENCINAKDRAQLNLDCSTCNCKGSMPPKSVSLEQEGAAIKSFKLVRDGEFQEQGITDLLMEPASRFLAWCRRG